MVEGELVEMSFFMFYKWDLDINGVVKRIVLEIMIKELGIVKRLEFKRIL